MTDFVSQICGALEKTGSNNTKDIKEATEFIQQAQQAPGCLTTLLTIVMQPQEVAKLAQDQKPEMICLRAVAMLKTIVNVSWDKPKGAGSSTEDKENTSQNQQNGNQYQLKAIISIEDRNFIKENIFEALSVAMFTLQNKQIQKEIENIFYNIVQNEFAEGCWNEVLPKICSLLQNQDENMMILGLRLLQELLRAFELAIDDKERKVMVSICEQTYPILESILGQVQQSQSPNQLKIMLSLCKIFLMSNQMKILTILLQQGRMSGWINFFIAILQFHQDGDLIKPTDNYEEIKQLDKHEYWKLKAVVCKISNRLLIKYQQNSNIHRFNDTKSQKTSERMLLQNFQKEFSTQYLSKLIDAHVRIILSKQGQFVGTKTMALSIKVCSASLSFKQARQVISQYVEKILFEISLPLFMTTQLEIETFTQDPVEYIRMQYSNSNDMNVKKQLCNFVQKLCSLKIGKKTDKQTSKHLSKYMETIFNNLNSMQGQDQETEALLMAFGNLHQKTQWNGQNMYNQVQQIMTSFVFNHLKSSSVLLQARACQLYAQYGVYAFQEQTHLEQAVNEISRLLWSECIVVRVEAAMALSSLLKHQQAVVGFLRPGLENVLKMYLKIMDEIDFEELVGALRIIVDTYDEEIAPYAVSLCQKLGEAYMRLVNQEPNQEETDTEAGLTADGLMSAIRRVLNSISGKFPKLYPELEAILEQPILLSLSEAGSTSADEGLSCIAELIYNQEGVSDRMWGLYHHIISSYCTDQGVLDDLVSQASVPLINFMDKAGKVFRDSPIFNGQTPLQLMFAFITKIFEDGTALGDEIHSMCAVTLIMALLEHIEGMEEHIHTINGLYLKEISGAEVQNYKNMLVQGIMMLFHYNLGATFTSFEQLGALNSESNILDFILQNIEKMDKDFEIKRMLIGLVTITLQAESAQLPAYVQERFPNFTLAMLWLVQKSLEVRTKKTKKQEEAIDGDDDFEKGVIYDEDEDEGEEIGSADDEEEEWDPQSDDELDSDLYNTKLDSIDDILFMRDALSKLQNSAPDHMTKILSCLQPEQQQTLQAAIAQAEALDNQEKQQELQRQQEEAANPQSDVQQIDLNC